MIPSMLFLAAYSLAAPVPDTSEEELKKIQGEWVVVKMAWQAEPWKTTGKSATIDRENFSISDRTGTSRHKIRRIKSGEIDLVKESLPAIGELHIGIYSLEGDTLKICFDIDGQSGPNPAKRPTKYESPKDSSYIVYFLERKKEAKKEDMK